jgi:peptide/nickel transport system permease protein
MIRYILKRCVELLLTLIVASFLVFAVCEFSPGNVARKTLGAFALPQQVELLYTKLHLNDPLMVRYVRWAGVLLGLQKDPLQDPSLGLGYTDPRGARYIGNFGYSTMLKAPVNDVLWNRLGNTAILAGIAFALIVPFSMLLGVVAGVWPGSVVDRTISVLSIVFTSTPEYALGVILVAVLAVELQLFPGTSPLDPSTGWSIGAQLVLPVMVLTLYDSGYVARIVRSSMTDVMAMPYIRTAVLKGLPRRTVILRHALRNAMIAPFTVILLQINWLIGGVVVTELVFAYPGFGRLLLDASLFGDIALIEAATLVALVIASLTQLLSDVGYRLLDPRVRLR